MNSKSIIINNLQALYKADFSHIAESVLRSLEATEEIQQLRQDIKSKIPNSDWSIVRSAVLLEMQQLLDIELYPILIDSWKTHQDVSREIETQNKSPIGEVSIVNLDQHEIKSTHSPCLSITIGDRVHLMRSFIGITLNLNNVTLIIKNGEINEVVSGTVAGKGFMQYQNATLIEKDFLEFDIAGITAIEESALAKNNVSTKKNQPDKNNKKKELIDNSTSNRQRQESTKAPSQAILQPEPTNQPKRASSKTLQFIIGLSLALFAVYLFWKLR